jgi:DNA-binding beta-propeller fold protein YncE
MPVAPRRPGWVRGTLSGQRAAIAAVVSVVLLVAACSADGPGTPASSAGPGSPGRPGGQATGAPPGRAAGALSLQIMPAPYQLPSGISREVVLARGPDLVIAGGLTARSASTAAVRLLNPVTGATVRAGRLAAPTHDAAGAMVGGHTLLFGGGDQTSVATVQAISPGRATVTGQLPGPRSDLMAVTVGGTAYLLGGYDGTSYAGDVLATSDGRHFTVVARLPVPVRYPAVAALGRQIWVFGGQTRTGITSDIQRITLPGASQASAGQPSAGQPRGTAAVAGHLPRPMTAGSAFTLGGTLYVAGGQVARAAHPGQATASPSAALVTSGLVLSYHPGRPGASVAGRLPVPVANAGVATIGGTAFLIGGDNGVRPVPTVTRLRLVAADSPEAATAMQSLGGDPAPSDPVLDSQSWLTVPHGQGHLAPHSDPSVLPGDVLIADHGNNRLLIVDPQGHVRWQFPRPGDLARGQTFLVPDDAFFSPDGKDIIATQEDDQVISVINIATHRIVYRYGTPGVPGAGPNHLSNPDDALILPGGSILAADIRNCRIVLARPPAHHLERTIGGGSFCWHDPPRTFGSPNGAFPMTNGRYLVTEINGDWVDTMNLTGHVYWSTNPPGVNYPSDTNEVFPGRYLTADYSSPGQVVEFDARGRLVWRFGGLNHPSLALPLPNGDILVNDDYNHRVIVIDPVSHRIVWQYGHTGVPGTAPGYLNDPDGVDVAPPGSLLITHAGTMGLP